MDLSGKGKPWSPYLQAGGKVSRVWEKARKLTDERWDKVLLKLEKLEQFPRLTPKMMLQAGHLVNQLIQNGTSVRVKARATALIGRWMKAGRLRMNDIP